MTPVKSGSYIFRKENLVEARQRIGLSQAKMAARIDVPQNTLSRWETGATVPDAHSLAAIYSVIMEEGIMPKLFTPVKQKAPVRDTAFVYWDLQTTMSLNTYMFLGHPTVQELDTFIMTEVQKCVPESNRSVYKAFSSSSRSAVADQLDQLDWRIWEDNTDWYEDIYSQALSDAGQNPSATVLFLITTNPDYVDLIRQLKGNNVRVYLMAPSSAPPELVDVVGQKRWIRLPI